jgi:biotin-(acetyl-CoA carboxylase) ligase
LLRSIISQEISEIATSIEAEINMKPNKDLLVKRLLEQVASNYELLKGQNGDEKIRSEWIKRSSYAFGKRVKVKLEKEILYGVTEGIGENGALILRLDSGDIRSISTGDVQELREN